MKIPSSAAFVVVVAAFAATPIAAQRGPTLGLNLNGGAIRSDVHDPATPLGGGAGLVLGYGVSDALTLFLRGTYGHQIGQVDAGARYSFGSPSARLRPYLEGALSRTGTTEGDLRVHGSALTGGAGVEYFVTRNLALDVGLTHTQGRFTDAERAGESVDIREGFASSRFNIGIRWHP